ncbi:MAG: alpha-glucuronidase [Bacteroidales bacterium]|jgi:alpha-glucuronidase|nr:alpha-glucuronidase [Bacteroidales bacterium]
MYKIITSIVFLALSLCLIAENGNRLWLPFSVSKQPPSIVCNIKESPTIAIAKQELQKYFSAEKVALTLTKGSTSDGYKISTDANNDAVIKSTSELGLLYGTYHLIRLQQSGKMFPNMNISETPSYQRRILNHWDNFDYSVERGYAGKSLWKWDELPSTVSPRYEQYARANASIGINGTVLNNVNANAIFLSPEILRKIKVLADIFRPYGIKVYLSINFSSPVLLGKLNTSDPLDKDVCQWWDNKVKEIYSLIPDFGGFLVKANSEGQPGPQDFGRTHADGANMLAKCLQPYGGIVMWRAFVYSPSGDDRGKQAYDEFTPLDGKFADNVIIQVKNGPIDFQPREPFNSLFGAMKNTSLMPELQVTQEYLGQSKHLVFLANMWQEFFNSDTYCAGKGSYIKNITANQKIGAIAGVANTGEDTNWCGSIFAQANWYAFGRLAWNNELTSNEIADEWIRLTFAVIADDFETSFIEPVKNMMLSSWETCVNYMMPVGLTGIFTCNDHYGPEPWSYVEGWRKDWNAVYYHRADSIGVGFDRTTSGSNGVSQYFPPLDSIYNSIDACPEKFLLWFHHVPWNYRMKNGKTLWENFCRAYIQGVNEVREYQKLWDKLEPYIDNERFLSVQKKLKIQTNDAVWWKDASLLYFQTFSRQPIPYDIERPVHDLQKMIDDSYSGKMMKR